MPQLPLDCPIRCHKLPHKCHINATLPQPSKPLKINDATNATNATTKKGFVCMQANVVIRTQKAPRKNTFFPRAKDMI